MSSMDNVFGQILVILLYVVIGFAAHSVLMSTIFFAATLPMIVFVGTRFL